MTAPLAPRGKSFLDAVASRARPLVMGVLNVTPDSFSDGGRHMGVAAARARALMMLAEGADLIDIGGESTRPGAGAVGETEELERVLGVIQALRRETDAPISIDTLKPGVARAAVGQGADIWNDVSALRGSPDAPATAAALGAPVILMHMAGEPRTMQDAPQYDDVVGEVGGFLKARVAAAVEAGLAAERILVDPGVGFGKTVAHNLALIAALSTIGEAAGRPLVFGASRKRFIQSVDVGAASPGDRLGGSLAAALRAAMGGARVIRAHDVRETVQALKVWTAIEEGAAE